MGRSAPSLIAILLLSACGPEKPTPPPPIVADIYIEPAPDWMTKQCPPPKKLPRKELSQAEAEQLWAEDLKLYHECRTKHAAYVRWVEQRDKALVKGFKKNE